MTIAHPELLLRWAKNRIYSKQLLHLTSTPPLGKIRSAGILSIWQKETTNSHIWTAIKFEYFDLTKIRYFRNSLIFPWFSAKFQIPWFFPAGIFFPPLSLFSLFSRVRVMLPTRRGSNRQPSDHQSDAHPTEPPRLAVEMCTFTNSFGTNFQTTLVFGFFF